MEPNIIMNKHEFRNNIEIKAASLASTSKVAATVGHKPQILTGDVVLKQPRQ